jgi:two-component system, chemotaxis family, protein-glutamate methylesterase/glutaminase
MMSFSESGAPTSVLVVEDADEARASIRGMIEAGGGFDIVGEAKSGFEAIRATHDLSPDIVVLGLAPMDVRGIELLAYISAESPRPVVVISSLGHASADPALATVDFGNIEFVSRPPGSDAATADIMRRRLLNALDSAVHARIGGLRMNRARRAAARARRAAKRATRTGGDAPGEPTRCAIGIAASTGGPRALLEIIPHLSVDLPACVLVVQHMPPLFTSYLAQRLDRSSPLRVKEAIAGELLKSGVVYLAPGGVHMSLQSTRAGVSIALEEGEPLWGLRPAADILFPAIARHFGPRSVGVVLTGMGKDGAAGLRAIQEVGGWTGIQDPATAVVASMPRSAKLYAHAELSLDRLAENVNEEAVSRSRPGQLV